MTHDNVLLQIKSLYGTVEARDTINSKYSFALKKNNMANKLMIINLNNASNTYEYDGRKYYNLNQNYIDLLNLQTHPNRQANLDVYKRLLLNTYSDEQSIILEKRYPLNYNGGEVYLHHINDLDNTLFTLRPFSL